METGAEYAVTQLFYDNRKYFDFVERARKAGVTIPLYRAQAVQEAFATQHDTQNI